MDWIGPRSGSDDEWSMFIKYIERIMSKKENKRGREGGQRLLGIESRNKTREANGINVVVSESSWS